MRILTILLTVLLVSHKINTSNILDFSLSQTEDKIVSFGSFFKQLFAGTVFEKMSKNHQINNNNKNIQDENNWFNLDSHRTNNTVLTKNNNEVIEKRAKPITKKKNHKKIVAHKFSYKKRNEQFSDPTKIRSVKNLVQIQQKSSKSQHFSNFADTIKNKNVDENEFSNDPYNIRNHQFKINIKDTGKFQKRQSRTLHQKRILIPKKVAFSSEDGLIELVVENHRKKLSSKQNISKKLAQQENSNEEKLNDQKFLAKVETKSKNIINLASNAFTNGKILVDKSGQIIREPNRLSNYSNSQYILRMGVGKKSKPFKFILDTGSTTLLLITNKCFSKGCLEHNSYKQGHKSTKISTEVLADDNTVEAISALNLHTIKYAEGYVKYETLVDDFWVGKFLIEGQSFGGVVKEREVFEGASYDGLVGLAYAGLGVPPGMKPLFDNIIEQMKLERNIFALYISRKGYKSSRFWLGGVNLQYIKDADQNKINWHPVIKKKWWTLKLDQVLVDGKDSGLCSAVATKNPAHNCAIIMDSGTSSMAAPSQTYQDFMKLLYKNGLNNSISSWPDLTFVIDGIKYELPNYSYLLVNNNITYQKKCSSKSDIVQPGFGSFASGDFINAIWIAGDSFQSEYITIFDRDNDMVGLTKPWLKNIERIQSEE